MRKNGILKYRTADFEVSVSKSALKLSKSRSKRIDIPIAGLPDLPKGVRMPVSQDEWLMYPNGQVPLGLDAQNNQV